MLTLRQNSMSVFEISCWEVRKCKDHAPRAYIISVSVFRRPTSAIRATGRRLWQVWVLRNRRWGFQKRGTQVWPTISTWSHKTRICAVRKGNKNSIMAEKAWWLRNSWRDRSCLLAVDSTLYTLNYLPNPKYNGCTGLDSSLFNQLIILLCHQTNHPWSSRLETHQGRAVNNEVMKVS